MKERSYSGESASLRSFDALITQKKPTYLFTGYLTKSARLAPDRALMFQITLGVRVPLFEINKTFWFDEHLEGCMYGGQTTAPPPPATPSCTAPSAAPAPPPATPDPDPQPRGPRRLFPDVHSCQ